MKRFLESFRRTNSKRLQELPLLNSMKKIVTNYPVPTMYVRRGWKDHTKEEIGRQREVHNRSSLQSRMPSLLTHGVLSSQGSFTVPAGTRWRPRSWDSAVWIFIALYVFIGLWDRHQGTHLQGAQFLTWGKHECQALGWEVLSQAQLGFLGITQTKFF